MYQQSTDWKKINESWNNKLNLPHFFRKLVVYCFFTRNYQIEDIQVFSIDTWFIFIEWYENKYFMSGGSHEWNMVIFMPQDEINHVFIEKTWIFCLLYTFFSFLR
jgi:hypothetical protein